MDAIGQMVYDAGSSPLTRGKLTRSGASGPWCGLIPAHAGKTTMSRVVGGGMTAHPRSRGENNLSAAQMLQGLGSSPLTRGKLASPVDTVDAGRLIPAHAGKTLGLRGQRPQGEAHPRSRGENANYGGWLQTIEGSSPLTRGKQERIGLQAEEEGLIPAHAGKTTRAATAPAPARAHPRSRGENAASGAAPTRAGGSSPLTRGKQTG